MYNDAVTTYSIAIKLPRGFNDQPFANVQDLWQAEGNVAQKFLPVLKAWLEGRGYLDAADSLYHVHSNYVILECNAEIVTYLRHSDLRQIKRITELEPQKQSNFSSNIDFRSAHAG